MTEQGSSFSMLKNKQLIHVAVEGIVLLGMAAYFSSKNKQLLGYVEQLSQRLEAQETQTQKLEAKIQQLTNALQSIAGNMGVLSERVLGAPTREPTRESSQGPKRVPKRVPKRETPMREPMREPIFTPTSTPIEEEKTPIIEVYDSQEELPENPSDLDEEIQEEMRDLQ